MSNGFQKFISGKGFYLALAVCLAGAGAAAWVAVDKTIQSVEPAPMAEKPQLKQEQPYAPASPPPTPPAHSRPATAPLPPSHSSCKALPKRRRRTHPHRHPRSLPRRKALPKHSSLPHRPAPNRASRSLPPAFLLSCRSAALPSPHSAVICW